MNEAASDSESSDSETCPKLSQGMDRRRPRPSSLMAHRSAHLNKNPYNSRPLSIAKSVMDKKGKRVVIFYWCMKIDFNGHGCIHIS